MNNFFNENELEELGKDVLATVEEAMEEGDKADPVLEDITGEHGNFDEEPAHVAGTPVDVWDRDEYAYLDGHDAVNDTDIEIGKDDEDAEYAASSEVQPVQSGTIIPFGVVQHGDYKLDAVEKLRNENEHYNGTELMGRAIKDALVKFLVSACNENEVVAEVIFRTVRTLGDCCDFVVAEMKKKAEAERGKGGFGSVYAASDTEVYTTALRFYFPDSEVKAQITLTFGQKPSDEEMAKAYERPVPPPKPAKAKKEKKEKEKKTKKEVEKPKLVKRADDQPLLEGFETSAPEERTEQEEPAPAVAVPTPVYTEKCADCGKGISDSDVSWSLPRFGKKLCPKCQKAASAKKNEEESIQLSLF